MTVRHRERDGDPISFIVGIAERAHLHAGDGVDNNSVGELLSVNVLDGVSGGVVVN